MLSGKLSVDSMCEGVCGGNAARRMEIRSLKEILRGATFLAR